MIVWPAGIFHRIISGEEGSISINFATRTNNFSLEDNFNIYNVNLHTGEYNIIKSKKEEITESFYRNAKEYFRDETDVVTSKKEINKYIEDVDNLKNKIEVMEVKLRNKK